MNDANLLPKLSKFLFWDYNTDTLDPDIDKRIILERVFTRGTEQDEREVFKYYGKAALKDTVVYITHLDKKALNYLSIIFNIPKEQFKCYKRTLSEKPFGIC
ncbi:MAG: hypothetical protein LBU28_08715 [Spirochaetaceae bacterium]|jgi:hypothetical protein|nr:hypothetical protein [Spirochaetaceae bacterium]